MMIHINSKTKEAVRKIAAELNNKTNHLPGALRSGMCNLMGMIVPRTSSNFFSLLIENMEEVLNKKCYNFILTHRLW
jgi:LacI family transcriptional regulator